MRRFAVWQLAAVLIAFVLATLAALTARAGEQNYDKTPFTDFLFAAGNKFDCYFTLEMWEPGDDHPSCFKDVKIRDEKPASIDVLIAELRGEIPGITVTRDPANPRILHLIDAGLLTKSRYALEKQKSIDFSGPLEDLPSALGKSMWYAIRRSEPSGGDFQNDVVTTVKVHQEQKKIRQILTDAVPLKKYGRVLWIAQTFEKNDGELSTAVTYVGPKLTTATGSNEGAVVEISFPAEYTFGRPMPATIVIRNTADSSFLCMEMGGLPNCKMEMELKARDTGALVPMTEGGQRIMESITRGGSMGLGRVKKGHSLPWPMKLDEFYAPPPGRYKFTAKFSLHRESDHTEIPVEVGPMDLIVTR